MNVQQLKYIVYMELFHVLNRGVDKRKIFLDDKDYFRFVHDLFEFNDEKSSSNTFRYFCHNTKNEQSNTWDVQRPTIRRELLVNIHAFSLMPNHYHMLLNAKVENGIPLFMKKVNMGYAKYFNQKYKRTGTLFEGRYKSVAVTQDVHLFHLPYYIHLNPLDLITPTWRERRVDNPAKAIEFLENYRWSSYLDYTGEKNFPSVTSRSFLSEIMGKVDNYKSETQKWLKGMDYSIIKEITLE